MYEALILVDPDITITADRLAHELRRFYEGKPGRPSEITLSEDTVTLRWPDYDLTVGRSVLAHVLEESAEIAEECNPDHPARERIARCECRFEMSGPPDPNMDHFNDSLFVGEALERLGRVYRFDQASGEFLE
jgi:hypothetical protein